nr:MAG TPA: endopeptidase [Caudoviricetes sp.]
MQMMQQMFGNDPAFNRAVQMAQGKNPQQIETVMKNLCEQRGMDFDQIKQTFNQFGMKL